MTGCGWCIDMYVNKITKSGIPNKLGIPKKSILSTVKIATVLTAQALVFQKAASAKVILIGQRRPLCRRL